jgi:small subunit ribosomal protein S6e
MVEFKVVVNNGKGKSYPVTVTGHHANSLIGKKIGDEIDGIYVSLPGYKLRITGGTDKDGVPMREDVPGAIRRRLLLSFSKGYKPKEHGKREKKSVRGNTIGADIVQINMRVIKEGAQPIDQILKTDKKGEEKK